MSGFAVAARWSAGDGGIEAVEDEEVALGVVECREGGDALEMVHGGEGVHLVVFDLVPGDVPAGMVGLDADGQIHGAEVVADGGQAGHEGELEPLMERMSGLWVGSAEMIWWIWSAAVVKA